MPKVMTTDDVLVVYQNRSLGSAPIQVPKGAEIRLGPSVVHEGREWMDTTLPDGTTGFVLGPTARGHTTLGDALDIFPETGHRPRGGRRFTSCSSCGNLVPGHSRFCLRCGGALEDQLGGATSSGRSHSHSSLGGIGAGEAKERKFFEDRGVIVTNARFITGEQTFAMSGITSVKSSRRDPSRTGPILWGALGISVMVGGQQLSEEPALIAGLVILVGSILYLLSLRSDYTVQLTTASGEVTALASRDGSYITKVVSALNDAIVHRG